MLDQKMRPMKYIAAVLLLIACHHGRLAGEGQARPYFSLSPEVFSEEDYTTGTLSLSLKKESVSGDLDLSGGYYYNYKMQSPLFGAKLSAEAFDATASAYYAWDKSGITGCLVKKGYGFGLAYRPLGFEASADFFSGAVYYADQVSLDAIALNGSLYFDAIDGWNGKLRCGAKYSYLVKPEFSDYGISSILQVQGELPLSVLDRNLVLDAGANFGKVWHSDFDFFAFKTSDYIRGDGQADRLSDSIAFYSIDAYFYPFPISSSLGQGFVKVFTDGLFGLKNGQLLADSAFDTASGGGIGYSLGTSRFSLMCIYSSLNKLGFTFEAMQEL